MISVANYPNVPMSVSNNELWRRGDLRHILCSHQQTRLYDFYHTISENSIIVFECHRRLGKTFLQLVLAVEQCLQNGPTVPRRCC